MASINNKNPQNFEDHLPIMAEKLGGDGLIEEICKGFQLIKDIDKDVITFDSLKKNAEFLGLQELNDDDLMDMLKEGDYDGDGALSEMEFCVLMFRLSPQLMEQAEDLLNQELQFLEAVGINKYIDWLLTSGSKQTLDNSKK
ncbi:calcium-binding protein PBP1-like [Silene latifolia]|uniref:calcium-binding protein PBP1-like n=1 Tax=Silene latifolia TaxID=37657 RepID=UPI003D76E77F